MKLIHKKTIIITDTFTNKLNYNLFVVVDDTEDAFPALEPIQKELNLKQGYQFFFNETNDIDIYIDYAQITTGKCALIAHLVSKTEIEQLTNVLWDEYLTIVDREIMDEVKRSNMSEVFFNNLNKKK